MVAYGNPVTTQVIVLNGGSSSGKSGIVRCLQSLLPDPWLAAGVDALIDSLPVSIEGSKAGIEITASGEVKVGPQFGTLQAAWMAGVAATAKAGAKIIIDDVFLGGAKGQDEWRAVLANLDVLWVGVRCDAEIAAGREIARGDRMRGMAAAQAETVHRGVEYDVEVDTTHTESLACAQAIAARVG